MAKSTAPAPNAPKGAACAECGRAHAPTTECPPAPRDYHDAPFPEEVRRLDRAEIHNVAVCICMTKFASMGGVKNTRVTRKEPGRVR